MKATLTYKVETPEQETVFKTGSPIGGRLELPLGDRTVPSYDGTGIQARIRANPLETSAIRIPQHPTKQLNIIGE
jgi:hypothetical protein